MDDPRWLIERAKEREAERKAQKRHEFIIYAIVIIATCLLSITLWRADDRTERLFNVVATERSCAAACSRGVR